MHAMHSFRNSFTTLKFLGLVPADYYFSDESSPTSEKPISDLPDITPEVDSFSEWSAWTACPVSCGGGRRLRERECLTQGKVVINCVGPLREIEDCNTQPCPGDARTAIF